MRSHLTTRQFGTTLAATHVLIRVTPLPWVLLPRTHFNQTYDGNFSGLGVVVLVDQNATVTNIGSWHRQHRRVTPQSGMVRTNTATWGHSTPRRVRLLRISVPGIRCCQQRKRDRRTRTGRPASLRATRTQSETWQRTTSARSSTSTHRVVGIDRFDRSERRSEQHWYLHRQHRLEPCSRQLVDFDE